MTNLTAKPNPSLTRVTRQLRAALLGAATMTALACGAGQHSTYNSSLKVIDGTPAEASTYPAVALLRPDKAGVTYVFCTGVLYSPKLVLTAAYCSLDGDDHPHAVESLGVIAGDSKPEANLDKLIKVSRVTVHPQFDRSKMGKREDGSIHLDQAHDIAMWELTTAVTSVKPAAIMSAGAVSGWLSQAQTVTIMGYGKMSPWESPWTEHQFAIADTGFTTTYEQRITSIDIVDGHPRSHKKTIQLPAYEGAEMYAGGRGKPDTCNGDSGGPLFAKTADGGLELLALTSRGSSTCSEGGIYTVVPAHQDWFNSFSKN